MNLSDLSETQKNVLRELHREYPCSVQLAGYAAAPRLSAARALCRKGLARPALATGNYYLLDTALDIGAEARAEYKAAKAATITQPVQGQ